MFSSSQVAPSDFNGDQTSDIVWRNQGTGQNEIWYVRGNQLHQSAALPAQIDLGWQIKGSGDFDGDNRSDLIWRNESTGENALWLMNNQTLLRELYTVSIGSRAWDISGVGDFNQDGRSDLIWHNEQTGQMAVWYMNGHTPESADALAPEVDRNWKIGGVGDFDGDGHDDLFWHNPTTGQSRWWKMKGAAKQEIVELGATRGQEWQVQGVGDFNGDDLAEVLWRNSQAREGQLEVTRFSRDGQLVETQPIEIVDAAEQRQIEDPHWQANTSGSTDPEQSLQIRWNPEKVTQGETYAITWESQGQAASETSQAQPLLAQNNQSSQNQPTQPLQLSLYRNSQFHSHLSINVPDSGVHHWTVPASLEPGDYRLQIADRGDRNQFDYSDLPFTVEAPTLELRSLNGGESLKAGETYEINWSSNFLGSSNTAELELYKGGQWLRDIEASTVNDGTTTWHVPSDLPSGSDYQVRIGSSARRFATASDWSDSFFTIDARVDLDIQLFDPAGAFNSRQWQIINQAADNWERIITADKDDSGQARVVVSQASNRMDGGPWQTAFARVLAEAFVDPAVGRRNNYGSARVDLNGVDYDNRVNWNPQAIQTMDNDDLLFTMMHELGHILGLEHVEDPDGLMFFSIGTTSPKITEESLQQLEQLGYSVDRTAAQRLKWNV